MKETIGEIVSHAYEDMEKIKDTTSTKLWEYFSDQMKETIISRKFGESNITKKREFVENICLDLKLHGFNEWETREILNVYEENKLGININLTKSLCYKVIAFSITKKTSNLAKIMEELHGFNIDISSKDGIEIYKYCKKFKEI